MLKKLIPKSSRASQANEAGDVKRGKGGKPLKQGASKSSRSKSSLKKPAPLFGSSIEQLGLVRARRLVDSCVAILREPAALDDPTLFRSGSVSDNAVRVAISRVQSDGGSLSLKVGEPPALAAAVLKRWLLALPQPLVPIPSNGSAETALMALTSVERSVACTVLLCVRHILDVAAAEERPPTTESMAKSLTPALLYGSSGGPSSGDREAVAKQVADDSGFVLKLLELPINTLTSLASGAASEIRPSSGTTLAGTATSASFMASSIGNLSSLGPISDADGPMNGIVIELSSVSLEAQLVAGYSSVQIEIDMPGPDEPLVTPAAPIIAEKGQPALANLDWAHEYDAATGSTLGEALAGSLEARDGESDVLFALLAADGKGATRELGAARCSLEEMLGDGGDLIDETLAIMDEENREIGQITCTVQAVNALLTLTGHSPSIVSRAVAPSRASYESIRPNSPPPDRMVGGPHALTTAEDMLASEIATRELRHSFEDLKTQSVKVIALARAVQEKEPRAEVPKSLIRRPNGDEGLLLGGEDIVHELRAALAAWDSASGATMEELLTTGALTTSQRKLLLHATTEVRLAKRAWSAHKIEIRKEREQLAEEIFEFSRKLNMLKKQAKIGVGSDQPDALESSKGGDILRSGVEVDNSKQDVVRSGVSRGEIKVAKKSAEAPKSILVQPEPKAELAEFSSQANEYLQVKARVRHHPSSAANEHDYGTSNKPYDHPREPHGRHDYPQGRPSGPGLARPMPPLTPEARKGTPLPDFGGSPGSQGYGHPYTRPVFGQDPYSPYASYEKTHIPHGPPPEQQHYGQNMYPQQQPPQQHDYPPHMQYPQHLRRPQTQPTASVPASYANGPRVIRDGGGAPPLDPHSTARFMSAAAAAHLLRQHAAGASPHGLDPRAAVGHARHMTKILNSPGPGGAASTEQLRRSFSAISPPLHHVPAYPGGHHSPMSVSMPGNAFATPGSGQAAFNAGLGMPPPESVRRSMISDHALAASRQVWTGYGYAH